MTRESFERAVVVERVVVVETAGPLTTVQDLGRPGYAHLGVTRSGAADRAALQLANRLVGNRDGAAGFEVTLGGFSMTPLVAVTAAVTGAGCPIRVNGRSESANSPLAIPAGGLLELATAATGLRAYVAVRGGIDVPPVLGSRSYDTLAGLGPRPLACGDVVALGSGQAPGSGQVLGWPDVDLAAKPPPSTPDQVVVVHALPGPRADWLDVTGTENLWTTTWQVGVHSDRVGVRLMGPALARSRHDELPSEGLVRGAVQLPPSGLPVLFLADHPVTGGYPVVAVLRDADVDLVAQLRPGQLLRLRR